MRLSAISIIILTFVITSSLYGQGRDYNWGYIVTYPNDTIEGWVKDRTTGTFPKMYPKIRFKESPRKFRKKYRPHQLRGYGYNNMVYESVLLEERGDLLRIRYLVGSGNWTFLRLIQRDEDLTYYLREFTDDDSNFIDSYPLFYLSNKLEMVRVTQGIFGLKRNRLAEYFSHCRELVEAIESKELKDTWEVYRYYTEQCAK